MWQFHLKIPYIPRRQAQLDQLLLEAIKNSDKKIKFYQASSSEMYGGKGEKV